MPHVVTQSCCSDASCVYACPVNCIHPTPDEPGFGTAEMLHIDPAACVDCGACVTACPVDAIKPHTALAPGEQVFVPINADFYRGVDTSARPTLAPVTPAPAVSRAGEPLRVAIVGTGPAAMYAADELLLVPNVEVDLLDRLPTPYGLARAGVAPDHQRTKQVTRLFDAIAEHPRLRLHLGVDVGRDVTVDEVAAHFDAVVVAVGAADDRPLDVPGGASALSATDFVAWYNGHPDHAGRRIDLSHERVVIVGNGNVALDAARILTMPVEALAATDIADCALEALRASRVREVVLVARRGPAQSAFTVPEFAGLLATPGVEVVVHDDAQLVGFGDGDDHATAQKLRLLRSLPTAPTRGTGARRIVLRWFAEPLAVTDTGLEVARTELVTGPDGVARAVRTGDHGTIDAGLVLTSIGYRGRAVPGLPFDHVRGTIPHEAGRVRPGVYVAGWIKRGPTGFLGTNKSCAQETVRSLLADFDAHALPTHSGTARAFAALVRERCPEVVDRRGWLAIDAAERAAGAAASRPRVKITDRADLVAAARPSAKPPALARFLARK